jgi:uncharacterized protein
MGAVKLFEPAWWSKNRHVQSCLPVLLRTQAITSIRWEEFTLPDGDFLDLAWAGSSQAPIVILLHGLEGSVNSHYIQNILDPLTAQGWQALTMHFRSCSGRLNRYGYSYYAGYTDDLFFMIEALNKRYPNQIFAAIGYSLGGNVLLHYLAQFPNSILKKAVVVSVPFELHKSADKTATFYQWNLLRSLKRKVIEKIRIGIEMPVDKKRAQEIRTMREFDELVTAPLNGFKNAEDYYRQKSTRPILNLIKHPTLLLHALDDPFIPCETIPRDYEIAESIQLEISKHGGHLGFIQGGLPWQPEYWLQYRILQFLNEN